MKKWIWTVLLILFIFGLTGCGMDENYKQGQSLLENEQYVEAIEAFKNVSSDSEEYDASLEKIDEIEELLSQEADEAMSGAYDLLSAKNYKEAMQKIDEGLAIYPDYEKAVQLKESTMQEWDEFVDTCTIFGEIKPDVEENGILVSAETNLKDGTVMEISIINTSSGDTETEHVSVSGGAANAEISVPEGWGACALTVACNCIMNDADYPQTQDIAAVYGENGEYFLGDSMRLDTNDNSRYITLPQETVFYPSQEAVEAEQIRQYKNSCDTYEYRVLNKDCEKLKGSKIKMKGQIQQIIENNGLTWMLFSITYQGYGYWSDNVAVTINGTIDYYEDDVITIWGEITGSYSYTSVAGYQITVPSVDGVYVS